jgi:hypothetical protein
MSDAVNTPMQGIRAKNRAEPEFLQAVEEVAHVSEANRSLSEVDTPVAPHRPCSSWPTPGD